MTRVPRSLLGLAIALGGVGCAARSAPPCRACQANVEATLPYDKRFDFSADTRCPGASAPFDTDFGCRLGEGRSEQVMFRNTLSRHFRLDRMTIAIDGKIALLSNDPLVLERDAFPIASLGKRDKSYRIDVKLDLRGRKDGAVVGYRFEVRSKHDTPPGTTLTVELYERPVELLAERPAVKYDEY